MPKAGHNVDRSGSPWNGALMRAEYGESLAREATEVGHPMLRLLLLCVTYFCRKLHLDQNEKRVMYGVTQNAGIDGYSGMVVTFHTMPKKNAITIYEECSERANKNTGIPVVNKNH